MVADVVEFLRLIGGERTERFENTHILNGGGGAEYDTRNTHLHRHIILPMELQEAEFRLFLYLQEQW